jgi:hypothetical protein
VEPAEKRPGTKANPNSLSVMKVQISEMDLCPGEGRSVQKQSTVKNGTAGTMTRKSEGNQIVSLGKLVAGLPTAEYVMNITVVYEESQTRKWGREVYQIMEKTLGANSVRGTWWKLADLGQPGVLAGAVSKAMRSDMIVVSVTGSEGLPLPFYYWVNSWLPHRTGGGGALVALLGEPAPRHPESGRLCRFLRTVARNGRMDFLVTERAVATRALKQAELGM